MRVVFTVVSLVVVAAAVVEIVLPGRGLYHAGWYNVALGALVVVIALAARKRLRNERAARARVAIVAIAFGAAIAGFASVASGLLAPDNRTIVGAPGARTRVGDLGGVFDFPLAQARGAGVPPVVLDRSGRAPMEIGPRWRDAGSFILRTLPRDVVSVEARDLAGGRLTITQPTGTAFLSPVLLMQQRQTITGMNLPYDSFAVPAAHRVVKAVLFTPSQAAMLRGGTEGVPAVLFAVDDENDRPLPHAIALAEDGETVSAGGLRLQPAVLAYPAVEAVAAPSLVATAIGALIFVLGLAMASNGLVRTRS